MDLFDATLLDAGVGATPPDGFVLRPLRSSDFGRGFTKLLAQLTRVGDYDATRFAQRFASMWRVNQEQATCDGFGRRPRSLLTHPPAAIW